MKKSFIFVFIIGCILIVVLRCDFIRDLFPSGKSELTFKVSYPTKNHSIDSVLFTGNDIQWLNGTSGEIRFINSATITKIKSFQSVKCFLESDSLFTATITLPAVSPMINDLVMNLSLNDGHFYFEDGFPDWIDNQRAKAIRIKNNEKRAPSWDRFVAELKKEGKYVEK